MQVSKNTMFSIPNCQIVGIPKNLTQSLDVRDFALRIALTVCFRDCLLVLTVGVACDEFLKKHLNSGCGHSTLLRV